MDTLFADKTMEQTLLTDKACFDLMPSANTTPWYLTAARHNTLIAVRSAAANYQAGLLVVLLVSLLVMLPLSRFVWPIPHP